MAKSATVIPFPTTTRAKNVYRRRAYNIRAEEAFKAGFMSVSRPERELIQLMRWTNFTGRDAVMSVAREMRRAQRGAMALMGFRNERRGSDEQYAVGTGVHRRDSGGNAAGLQRARSACLCRKQAGLLRLD